MVVYGYSTCIFYMPCDKVGCMRSYVNVYLWNSCVILHEEKEALDDMLHVVYWNDHHKQRSGDLILMIISKQSTFLQQISIQHKRYSSMRQLMIQREKWIMMVIWWRVGKDLATTDHTLEKGKHEGLAPKDLCDGEEQVDAWIRCIKEAMENHISLSIKLKKKRWPGYKWSYVCIEETSMVISSRWICSNE